MTEEETRLASEFAAFVQTNRVSKGPTLSSATEKVFEAFSDFLEDRGRERYDHVARFRKDKWFWNTLFERFGFSTGGGLGIKRTTGFCVTGSRDPVDDAVGTEVELFDVFKGKSRLAMVASCLMNFAGDLVSDEVINELVDGIDRAGVNGLTTEDRYKTSQLHASVTALVENGIAVPPEMREWLLDHRAKMSEKVYSLNALKKSRSCDFFQDKLRWPPWDALASSDGKRARRDEECWSSTVNSESAERFLGQECVSMDPDAWMKTTDFRKAFLGEFMGEDPRARRGRPTNEDLKKLFEPFGLEFTPLTRRGDVRAEWVRGVRLANRVSGAS
eukprot:jgi/Mesvir1/7751/Mv11694-RA.1